MRLSSYKVRDEASCSPCMRSSLHQFVSMLRPVAVRWRAAGPSGCTCSSLELGRLHLRLWPRGLLQLRRSSLCWGPRTSCLASGLGCNGPAPALPFTSRSPRQQLSNTERTAQRGSTERVIWAAAGPDDNSTARAMGRRAAERVKEAEPQLTDDWGKTADRGRRSSAQPSTNLSGGRQPPGNAASSGRGSALRSTTAAGRMTQQVATEDGPVAGGGGDGRARRYLDRIAGLKAVPEDYNRC